MDRNIQENGKTIKCMGKVTLHGPMEKSLNYNSSYVGDYLDDKKHGYGEFQWPDGRKYRVIFFYFRVDGKMDNNMEEVYTSELMELKNKENGDQEKKSLDFSNVNNFNIKYKYLIYLTRL